MSKELVMTDYLKGLRDLLSIISQRFTQSTNSLMRKRTE